MRIGYLLNASEMKSPALVSLVSSSSLIPQYSQEYLTEYETEMRHSATYATNRAENSLLFNEFGSFIGTPCTSTTSTSKRKNSRRKSPAFGSSVRPSGSIPNEYPEPPTKDETPGERRNDAEAWCEARNNGNPDGSLVPLSRSIEELEACTTVVRAASGVVGVRAQLEVSEERHAQKIQDIGAQIALARARAADVRKGKALLGEIKKIHQQEMEELKKEYGWSTKKADRLTAHILALQRQHQTEVRTLNIRVETAVSAEKVVKNLLIELEEAEKKQKMEIEELREMHIQARDNEQRKTLTRKITHMENKHEENREDLCTEHKIASANLHAEIQTSIEQKHQEEVHKINHQYTQRRAATAEKEVARLKEHLLSMEHRHQAEIQKINEQLA